VAIQECGDVEKRKIKRNKRRKRNKIAFNILHAE
jgi:hypothetical protein